MTSRLDALLDRVGRAMARHLEGPSSGYVPFTPSDFETLCKTLRPADVLLIEGRQRVSTAIKYLTQSTWSHAAMYVGAAPCADLEPGEPYGLVEVNLGDGCVASPLSKYETFNTRICRPVGLSKDEARTVINFMVSRIGLRYDMRNILDLARYFLPTPPVPVRWRRRMLALGSGDPTRAICSSLIAQAFQSVRYPILPDIHTVKARGGSREARREILHVRHHSLFAPRDFDLSPYFEIIKPHLVSGFDHRRLDWADPQSSDPDDGATAPVDGDQAREHS